MKRIWLILCIWIKKTGMAKYILYLLSELGEILIDIKTSEKNILFAINRMKNAIN